MIEIQDLSKCCGCHACAQICPKECIMMEEDQEGFLYPKADQELCIGCGLCEKVCPILNPQKENSLELEAYAAYYLDEEIRLKSSSGGIFSLLAEEILHKEGVVYGAAMVGVEVKHIRVIDKENMAYLRGSKYVQSKIGTIYLDVKKDLQCDKWVLFTGTPCQIEGLQAFLRRDYERLICMDFICHGVPSPMVWRKYISFREKEVQSTTRRISFRDKHCGWKNYSLSIEFEDKSVYLCNHYQDPFMKAFLYDLCLRPSCYSCAFKKVNRISDITVADFWQIEKINAEWNEDKGTSLVIIHSDKGKHLFNAVKERLWHRSVNFNDAIMGNSAMVVSVEKPKARSAFMRKVHVHNFERIARKYAREPLTVKRFIKKLLKNIGLLEIVKKVICR